MGLITRRELQDYLQVSHDTIKRMEKRGMPVLHIMNNKPRYKLEKVLTWIGKNTYTIDKRRKSRLS